MQRKWIGVVALGLLMAVPVMADNTAGKTEKTAGAVKKEAGAAPGKKEASKKTEGANSEKIATAVELEIQQLKELIQEQAKVLEAQRAAMREQQEKLEAVAAELREVGAKSNETSVAPAAEPGAAPVTLAAVAQEQEDANKRLDKMQKDVEGKIKGIGPFSFSGDLRLRYEAAVGGNAVNAPEGVGQHRERFRLRVNANAKFNDEFSGGFSLASGDLNNPLSTNQTLTTFYIRKPIGIDRAFATYNPRWFKPLSVTAGKFAYTWYRTELMWDNDLNPEGLSESVHWNWKDSFLQHFGIVALQNPLNSSFSGAGNVTAPTPSSAMFGGQLQTNWKFADWLKFGAYGAFYHFRNPDQIAQNQVGGAGPTTGALAGNNLTNFVGTIGSRRVYASQFDVLDVIARFDFNTGISRFPLMTLFNYAQNTEACGNIGVFTAAGVAPPFCDPKQRHAYWAEVQLGRTQEQGDWRFGYTFMRIERDAVPSAFNFDDKRQATNVAQHRMEIFYQAYRNITFGFTGFFGRQLVTATSPTTSVTPERFLKRFQVDLIYKF